MRWSCSAIRELDRRAVTEYGVPSIVLMENAGRGVADVMCLEGIHGTVLICCGKGNNAGDGLVIARHLDLRGYDVRIACWSDPQLWCGDTAIQYQIVARSGLPLTWYHPADATMVGERPLQTMGLAWQADSGRANFCDLVQRADWIVDALFGTGTLGAPRSPYDEVIRAINARTPSTARVLSVDLPSGLNADSGVPEEPTIRSDLTCTFVAEKTGFGVGAALPMLGRVVVLDIGAPRRLIEQISAEL